MKSCGFILVLAVVVYSVTCATIRDGNKNEVPVVHDMNTTKVEPQEAALCNSVMTNKACRSKEDCYDEGKGYSSCSLYCSAITDETGKLYSDDELLKVGRCELPNPQAAALEKAAKDKSSSG
ncbi:uncharacterized protein LOC141909020 [Tubulanus polymorphus]|uniref:uncharacterized protein LOC141909020 n=1 Tax=Tubulanus polymorphus TaxID=672921 RepID=UPI003DA34D5A